jgi:hypothetical protein
MATACTRTQLTLNRPWRARRLMYHQECIIYLYIGLLSCGRVCPEHGEASMQNKQLHLRCVARHTQQARHVPVSVLYCMSMCATACILMHI